MPAIRSPVPLTLLFGLPAATRHGHPAGPVATRFKQPLPCAVPVGGAGALVPSRYNLDLTDGRAVYNTTTGAFLELTTPERQVLQDAAAGVAVRAEDAPRLHGAGFLLDRRIDEVDAVRRAFRTATSLRYAPQLAIAPTMDCNFGCDYCFETHTRTAMNETTQDALARFAARLLDTAGSGPDLGITWFGGEPLMAMGVIEGLTAKLRPLIDQGRATTYTAKVITNGYLLTPNILDRLLAVGVRQIQVTIDGPRAVHDIRRSLVGSGRGTFERIVSNVRHAADRVRVVVRINVDRDNAGSVRTLMTELDGVGLLPAVHVDLARVEAFATTAIGPHQLSAQEFAAWREELHRWAHDRGWTLAEPEVSPNLTGVCQVDSVNSFVVDPRGRLFKCWAELGTSARPVGDLTDPQTWPQGPAGDLAARDPFDDEVCLTCQLLPLCLGSCPKTRAVGRDLGMPECPPFRHHIRERILRQHRPGQARPGPVTNDLGDSADSAVAPQKAWPPSPPPGKSFVVRIS
jgi:uncharacterized protein